MMDFSGEKALQSVYKSFVPLFFIGGFGFGSFKGNSWPLLLLLTSNIKSSLSERNILYV